MATDQKAVKLYLPADEAAEFTRIVRAEDKTITAVLRRLIREYVAATKAAA
jgi:hypothetical protein